MQDRYTLNEIARAKLASLRAQGVEPTDDDIVLINALAADLLSPGTRRALARGRPSQCGDVWLWPLTINSSDWFTESGCNMPDPTAALAYALAHGNDPDLIKADWKAVKRWHRRLHVRPAELDLAVADCISQDEETEIPTRESDNANGMTAGELSAAMMATVGGDPAMWECQVSIGYIRAILETTAAQQKAGGVAPSVTRATMALGMACEKIKNREHADE